MRLVILATLTVLAACQTRTDLKSAPSDDGVAATYAADFDTARRAARDALGEASFGIREDKEWDGGWRIIASQGLTSGTFGRIARVLVQRGSETETVVRVLVRSKLDTRDAVSADQALSEDLQKKIAARLAR